MYIIWLAEEGVYNDTTHGIKMEAAKFKSEVTDSFESWQGQFRPWAYQNHRERIKTPFWGGQVMSYNDPGWSVFWGCNMESNPHRVPLFGEVGYVMGKHVGEDPDTIRAPETIGYVIIDGSAVSHYQIGDTRFQTGSKGSLVGADTLKKSSKLSYTGFNGGPGMIGFMPNAAHALVFGQGIVTDDSDYPVSQSGNWTLLKNGNDVTLNRLDAHLISDGFGSNQDHAGRGAFSYIVFAE
jgi:hypothetical protein